MSDVDVLRRVDLEPRCVLVVRRRAFAWAEKMGLVTASPLRHLPKPAPARRERKYSASGRHATPTTSAAPTTAGTPARPTRPPRRAATALASAAAPRAAVSRRATSGGSK